MVTFQITSKMQDERQDDKQWQVCCSKTERGFIKYVVQVIFALLTIVFCMGMLITNQQNREFYIGLLSAIIGLMLPHPTFSSTPQPAMAL